MSPICEEALFIMMPPRKVWGHHYSDFPHNSQARALKTHRKKENTREGSGWRGGWSSLGTETERQSQHFPGAHRTPPPGRCSEVGVLNLILQMRRRKLRKTRNPPKITGPADHRPRPHSSANTALHCWREQRSTSLDSNSHFRTA